MHFEDLTTIPKEFKDGIDRSIYLIKMRITNNRRNNLTSKRNT
jgi:hypothetical protein